MSGECNYCGGDHADQSCDAPREHVYENGMAAGWGREAKWDRAGAEHWYMMYQNTRWWMTFFAILAMFNLAVAIGTAFLSGPKPSNQQQEHP